MRACVVNENGGPEVLQLQDMPDPVANDGQVVVDIDYAGVNFTDLVTRLGMPGMPTPPLIPGIEVAGTVRDLGQNVDGWEVGQRVVGLCWPPELGGYAERVALPAARVIAVPDEVDLKSAAAIPVNYMTAHAALDWMAQTRPGERVLIHAGGGGVGMAAIQLARLKKAEIFATASKGKHAALQDKGVAHAIDYRNQDFESEVMHLTDQEGVDVVLDCIGPVSYQKSYRVLSAGGRLVCFGASEAFPSDHDLDTGQFSNWGEPDFSSIQFAGDARGVMGCSLNLSPDLLGGWLADLFGLCIDGQIDPEICAVFKLSEAGDAHRFIHERKNVGKVLIEVKG